VARYEKELSPNWEKLTEEEEGVGRTTDSREVMQTLCSRLCSEPVADSRGGRDARDVRRSNLREKASFIPEGGRKKSLEAERGRFPVIQKGDLLPKVG